jgi:NAD(P)-dependent dehydrogenase (short-subunit alcohol dehydrogenase family)
VHPRAAQRFDLTGRVIWVPGGAGLLGSAVCRALAEHGATVVIADVRGDEAARLADELRHDNLPAEATPLDVADEAAVVEGCAAIVRRHGRLDGCVNMTFRYSKTPWEQMTTQEWEYGMRVSLTGAFLLSRESAKAMKPSRRGSIVHFGSMYGVVSPDPRMYPPNVVPNPIDYGAAKAGVQQLVRYLAVALAPDGVRVNAIIPGPFPYPWSQQKDEEFMARLRSKVPLGRVGDAPEIAGAAVFLCSDASSYVTGTQVVVDGGWTAW